VLRLTEIRDLAHRFVPGEAADMRLYEAGSRSWWPAHEIGHFLVATRHECRQYMFGIDDASPLRTSERYRYVIAKENAATSISQRLLRRSGHTHLADEEIAYTDEDTLECGHEHWCRHMVDELLRAHRAARLPATHEGLEALLARKAREVGTPFYPSRRAAHRAARSACQTS
jgi:hypothetical protein